jgi:hypothetical protein
MKASLQSTRNYTNLAILLWFIGSLVAGYYGLFVTPGTPPIYLGLFIAVPFLGFAGVYLISPRFRDFAHTISLPLIVRAHAWRYVGIFFVIAYLMGKLPPQFGIPEGGGDIITAIFSFPLALALRQGKPVRTAFVAWNVFGLVDLISAITVGALYSEGSFGFLRTGVSTALMTTFPVNIIPTFFVPLFILLHLLALARTGEVGSAYTAERELNG